MALEFIKPANVFNQGGYTPAVTVSDAKLVVVSGQVAWDADGKLVGVGDLRAQLVQVFENLKAVLEASGATFDHVVKLGIFVVDFKPEDRAIIVDVRNRYLNLDKPPASTLLGVQALAAPDLLVEVEALAVVPEA